MSHMVGAPFASHAVPHMIAGNYAPNVQRINKPLCQFRLTQVLLVIASKKAKKPMSTRITAIPDMGFFFIITRRWICAIKNIRRTFS